MKRLGSVVAMLTVAAFVGGVLASAPAIAKAKTKTIHVDSIVAAK